jgi:FkbM family methyltransferase
MPARRRKTRLSEQGRVEMRSATADGCRMRSLFVDKMIRASRSPDERGGIGSNASGSPLGLRMASATAVLREGDDTALRTRRMAFLCRQNAGKTVLFAASRLLIGSCGGCPAACYRGSHMGLEHRRYLNSALLSSVLSKLPAVVRNAISVSGCDVAVAGLTSAEPWFRWKFFDALSERRPRGPAGDLCFVRSQPESFLVNLNDRTGPSKELFVLARQTEFDKFELAMGLVQQRRPRPTILMDVGGNIGTICIPAVARGLVERAVAIEPNPLNCRLLKANAVLNGVADRIRLFEAAAGAVDGETLSLEIVADNAGGHWISTSQEAREHSSDRIEVASVRLDSLLPPDDASAALVWMDVQGFEGHALTGAKTILDRRTPIVAEFDPGALARADGYAPFREALSKYSGFYDLSGPEAFHPIASLDALRQAMQSNRSFTDLLFVD